MAPGNKPQNVLGACRIDPEGHYERIIVEFLAVQQDYTQIQIVQPTFQNSLELPGIGSENRR